MKSCEQGFLHPFPRQLLRVAHAPAVTDKDEEMNALPCCSLP